MKLKILLLIVGVAIVGSSITVIVMQPRSQQLPSASENQLPTVISNYGKTFKLKTSPPIWGQATNGNH